MLIQTKRGTFTLKKKVKHQVYITITKVCTPNNKDPKYINEKLIEMKEVDKSTITPRDFNIQVSTTDRMSEQKISKATHFNRIANHLNLTENYRTLHQQRKNAHSY